MNEVVIDGTKIGPNNKPYIIAELSANHNGSIERALKTMEMAASMGADAIKIQTYTADTMTIDCDKPDFMIEGGLWDGYKLYDYATLGNNGERRFKFIVQPSPSQDHKVSFFKIEKPFLSLDENELIKKIRQLNNDDDWQLNNGIDLNELPDALVAAINVGVENFRWDEKKVLNIINH